jgi:peptidoglycan/LPS O-acetylase OafA/YrhL
MDKKPHFYHLDTLRAMAALLVMLCHARCVTLGYYPELVPESQGALVQLFYLVCSQGAWAVATFFVLSGFLVGGKTVERIQRGQISARKYALDRMFRIGVPLFGATVLIVVTNLIVGDPIEPWQLLGQFAGLQGVLVGDAGGVFWTLAYEIWFYFLLLGVILFVSSRRYVMGGVLLVVSLGVIGMLEPSWFFAIVAGVVAYFFRQRCLAKKSVMALFALAAIGFVMYYCAHSSGTARFACLDDKFAPFYLVAFAGMMALGISQIVSHEPKGRVLKLINNSGG